MEAEAMPLPRDETTPPVTKRNLVSPGFGWLKSICRASLVAPGAEPSRSRARSSETPHRARSRSGRLEQLTGVTIGRLVPVRTPEHPDDLGDQLVARNPLDGGGRLTPADALLDPEMSLGDRRHLRQVGDAEDLPLGTQRP